MMMLPRCTPLPACAGAWDEHRRTVPLLVRLLLEALRLRLSGAWEEDRSAAPLLVRLPLEARRLQSSGVSTLRARGLAPRRRLACIPPAHVFADGRCLSPGTSMIDTRLTPADGTGRTAASALMSLRPAWPNVI